MTSRLPCFIAVTFLVSQSWRKPTLNIHCKDWGWNWSYNTLVSDGKSHFIGKDLDTGKDWTQRKWAAEDKMVRQHHRLSEQESEQTPGDSEGQGRLVCCSPWNHSQTQPNNCTTVIVIEVIFKTISIPFCFSHLPFKLLPSTLLLMTWLCQYFCMCLHFPFLFQF